MLAGNPIFSKFQGRDKCLSMHENIELHPVFPDDTNYALDHLYCLKYFMIFFNKTLSSTAYYSGALSLDGLIIATKAWSCANIHLPMKSDLHSLHFWRLPTTRPNYLLCLFFIDRNRPGCLSSVLVPDKHLLQNSKLWRACQKIQNKLKQ